MHPLDTVTLRSLLPVPGHPDVQPEPSYVQSDVFERLVPNQSTRPMANLLGAFGVPVAKDSWADHILHACLIGACASVVAAICAPLLGLQYAPLMLSIIVVANILDFYGPDWCRTAGESNRHQ